MLVVPEALAKSCVMPGDLAVVCTWLSVLGSPVGTNGSGVTTPALLYDQLIGPTELVMSTLLLKAVAW